MANVIKSPFKGVAITMLAAGAIEALRGVKISADNTFDTAGSNEHIIGWTTKASLAANDLIAVELRQYTKKVEILASGAVVAGEYVKAAAASGANQRVAKFVPGTDAEERKVGVCLIGGTDVVITILA